MGLLPLALPPEGQEINERPNAGCLLLWAQAEHFACILIITQTLQGMSLSYYPHWQARKWRPAEK